MAAAGNSRTERPGAGRPPVLFLSHSGVDTEAARALKRRLEESPDARAAGLTVWFDKDDLPAGRDWMESLEDNIAESTAFAVYVGTRGVVDWVRREVRLALTRSTSVAGYPFIPVFAPESAGETDLPPFARQHQGVRDPLADPGAMAKLLRAVLGLEADAPVEAIEAPYVGLRAMDEAEADRFFGRERELDELVDKVRERRLVALVADSGTGKSSLVRAGLIPAWRRRELAMPGRTEPDGSTWHVVVTRPGTNPQAELGKAVMTAAEKLGRSDADKMGYLERVRLADAASADRDRTLEVTAFALLCGCPAGATQTLLVVDQFEELFTQAPADKRAAFVDLLLHLTDEARSALPFRVVLTLRADYESLLREFPALRAALDRGGTDLDRSPGEVRLKGLSDDGLARIVHEPMRLAGHADRLDRTRLLNAIRQDLDRRPGDTALLAVALFRVWEKYRPAGPDDLLTVYHEIGRIAGALGDAARETIGRLAPAEQALLQGLWARLVQPGEGRAPTRRIAQLDEFGTERQALAQSLANESRRRLLLTTATTVEIAHEALFAQWDVLREFVVGNAQPLGHLGRLMTAARDWNELRAERRPRLSPFDRLRAAFGWSPPPEDGREQAVEQGPDRIVFAALARDHPDWLSDSEHRFVAASEVEAARKQANEQWVTKSLALAGGIATSGAVVATILAGLAIWFGFEARQQAKTAEKAVSTAEDAAKTAEDAALIALRHQREADRQRGEAERQQRVAEEAAQQARRERNAALISQSRYVAVAARRLVAMGDSGTALSLLLEVLPSRVGAPDRPWEELAEGSLQIALLHLRERKTVRGHESGVVSAVFSADGRRVLTASIDGTARLWDVATGKELVVLRGHENLVYSAVFSGDGSRVVTASSDRTARLWDAASGKELVTLRGHENDVVRAVFSPDGRRVLTASYDRTARLWDADTGKELVVLRGHENEVIRAMFSPDGRRALTASTDGTVRLSDAATGKELVVLRGHESVVYSALFSADGARVLTASSDRTARLWNAASGKELTVLHHEDQVLGAVFSVDEARVLTASADGTARLWDTASGTERTVLRGHESTVSSAAFSADGSRVVTGSNDRTARLWDAASGKELAVLRGHEGTLVAALFSADGTQVLTASADRTARLWGTANGRELTILQGHGGPVGGAAFSADGTRVVTVSADGTARVWESASGRTLSVLRGHEGPVSGAVFSADGGSVLTVSSDRTARLWDAASGRELIVLRGHESDVLWAVLSADGTRVLTASSDLTVRLWDAASGKELTVLRGHEEGVFNAAFSADGARVVTMSNDNTVRLRDAASGKELAVLRGHEGKLSSAVLSADGTRVLTASYDRTARLWDAASGKELMVLRGHEDWVFSATFSADGARVATTSHDNTVRLWDAASGRELAVLRGHESPAFSAVFSADGARVLTASADRTARLWDAASGAELAALRGHEGVLTTAMFSADGSSVLTSSHDGTARIWRLPRGQELLDRARALQPGPLSPERRKEYFLEVDPSRK